jgi:hypothetical protein
MRALCLVEPASSLDINPLRPYKWQVMTKWEDCDLRLKFQGLATIQPALQDLAKNIAITPDSLLPGQSVFLSNRRKQLSHPSNFLANGASVQAFELPTLAHAGLSESQCDTTDPGESLKLLLAILSAWKFHGVIDNGPELFGYSNKQESTKGLALLFDPLVDFGLASHLIEQGRLPDRPRVLVMTDYYPLGLLPEILPSILKGKDWASCVTLGMYEPMQWSFRGRQPTSSDPTTVD